MGEQSERQGNMEPHPAPQVRLGFAFQCHPTPRAWLRRVLCVLSQEGRSRCSLPRFASDAKPLFFASQIQGISPPIPCPATGHFQPVFGEIGILLAESCTGQILVS